MVIYVSDHCYGNNLAVPLEAPDAVALSISIASLPLFSLMSVLAPCGVYVSIYEIPCISNYHVPSLKYVSHHHDPSEQPDVME